MKNEQLAQQVSNCQECSCYNDVLRRCKDDITCSVYARALDMAGEKDRQIRERFIQKINDYQKRSEDENATKDKRFAANTSTWIIKQCFNEIFPELPPIEYDDKTKTFN